MLKWTTSDATIATIDDEGLLKALKAGTFTLKAEATDGSGTFAETEVTVTDVPKFLAWNEGQQKLVATPFPATVTKVKSSDATWSAGTYVVEGEVTINGSITLNGDVDLIIKDGAKLTVNNQINGNSKNLRIYGQANQTGQLVVNYSEDDAIYYMTTLEVHSCKVKATSSNNNNGGFNRIGTFYVYGGSVDGENTGSQGYGIKLANNGSMNIYGGDVKAVGKGDGTYSLGIRGGGSTVTVYGGTLWAECAGNKAFDTTITLTKGGGFTGKIEYSVDKSYWSETADASAKYVRVDY